MSATKPEPQPAPPADALTIPPPSTLTALSDVQVGLTELLKLIFPKDAALHRTINRLRRMRFVAPPVEFPGLEALFQSSSEGEETYRRVGLDDDGQEPTIACDCPGRGHPWCIHRLRFRLELAELALRDPVELLERISADSARLYVPGASALPTAHLPEANLPPWLPDEPPPSTDEVDPREEEAPASRPLRASAHGRIDVALLLTAIEDEYPL